MLETVAYKLLNMLLMEIRSQMLHDNVFGSKL